jgi:hypothetical protein
MKKLLLLFLVAVFLGAGCVGTPSSAPNQVYSDEVIEEAHLRFQEANVEVLDLLTEASKQDIAIEEYRAEWGEATLQSATDMVAAADEIEMLRNELQDALGK